MNSVFVISCLFTILLGIMLSTKTKGLLNDKNKKNNDCWYFLIVLFFDKINKFCILGGSEKCYPFPLTRYIKQGMKNIYRKHF